MTQIVKVGFKEAKSLAPLLELDTLSNGAPSLPDKAAMAAEIAADWRLGGDKLVALVLLFRFHNTKTGQCYPSYERLAAACCLTRRAVIKIILRLEAAGWLIVDRTAGGRNKRNQFRFKLCSNTVQHFLKKAPHGFSVEDLTAQRG